MHCPPSAAGSLPAEWAHLTRLTKVWLYKLPRISGTIPEAYSALANLVEFTASRCGLTGPLPSTWWGAMQYLRMVDMSGNKLQGKYLVF